MPLNSPVPESLAGSSVARGQRAAAQRAPLDPPSGTGPSSTAERMRWPSCVKIVRAPGRWRGKRSAPARGRRRVRRKAGAVRAYEVCVRPRFLTRAQGSVAQAVREHLGPHGGVEMAGQSERESAEAAAHIQRDSARRGGEQHVPVRQLELPEARGAVTVELPTTGAGAPRRTATQTAGRVARTQIEPMGRPGVYRVPTG